MYIARLPFPGRSDTQPWPNELDNIQAQDMLPSPAEKQELLLQWLDGMPPVEHERFLGNWLYLLVHVHNICSLFP